MAQSLRFCSAAFPLPQNEREVVNVLTMSIKNVHDELVKVREENEGLQTELSLANERLQALEDMSFLFSSKDRLHKIFASSFSSHTAAGSPTSQISLALSNHNLSAGDKSQECLFNGFADSVTESGKVSPILKTNPTTLDPRVESPLVSAKKPYGSLVDAILGPTPALRGPRPEPGSPLGAANMTISSTTVINTADNTGNSETAKRALWIANRETYVSQKRGQAFNTMEEVRLWQERASRDGLEQSAALKRSQRDAEKVIEGDKKGKKKENVDEKERKGKAKEIA